MTQLQFDMICKIIQNGAPVLAQELCEALNAYVIEHGLLVEELRKLKEAKGEPDSEKSDSDKAEEAEK